MQKVIYACDLCGKEGSTRSLILPIVCKTFNDYRCEGMVTVKVQMVDTCDDCAAKIYESLDPSFKEIIRRL